MLLTELLVDVLCSRGVAQVQRASLCDADGKIISWALSMLIERQTLIHRARGPRKPCHSTCGERGGNDAALIVSAGHELVRLNIPMKEARLLPTRRSRFLELIR